jgi:hypothetical protein
MIVPNPKAETGCCERFNPAPWDEKEIRWDNKPFIKDKVKTFFHFPIDMGKVIVRNIEKIQKAGATGDTPLMLHDCHSMFSSDIMILTSKEVPDSDMVRISGTFLTKVFEGPYSQMGKWTKEMKEYVKSKGKETKKIYYFYTTCPRCAKHYGKNYTVILAQVD